MRSEIRVLSSVVVGTLIAMCAGVASASYERIPGLMCVAADDSLPAVTTYLNGDETGGIIFEGPTTANTYEADCPFLNSDTVLNDAVTAIDVDLYNPTATTIPASCFGALACVFSGWTSTCASAWTTSAAITAGSHTTIALTGTKISPFTNDTGNGYGHVLIEAGENCTNYMQGLAYTY